MDLQEVGCRGIDGIELAQDRQEVGTCECGNEASGSIKCGEFLDELANRLASQEELCCME
jgi:hypothetical protein